MSTEHEVFHLQRTISECFGTHAAGGHSYLEAIAISLGKGEVNLIDIVADAAETQERIANTLERIADALEQK